MTYSIAQSSYHNAVEIWGKNNIGQARLVAIVRGTALVSATQAAQNRISKLEYPYGC
jgi:hypothetical protein